MEIFSLFRYIAAAAAIGADAGRGRPTGLPFRLLPIRAQRIPDNFRLAALLGVRKVTNSVDGLLIEVNSSAKHDEVPYKGIIIL